MNNENVCVIFGVNFGIELLEEYAVLLDGIEEQLGMAEILQAHHPEVCFRATGLAHLGAYADDHYVFRGVLMGRIRDQGEGYFPPSCACVAWDIRYFTNTGWNETSDREEEFEDYEIFELRCSPP